MKIPLLLSISLLGVASLSAVDTKVTLSGVHNCCDACTNAIKKAAEGIRDVTITAERENKDVVITAKSKMNAKKAVEAIMAAGYYGKVEVAEVTKPGASTMPARTSSLPPRPPVAAPAKPDKKLTTATVTGAHLCCPKCVEVMERVVTGVPGVKKATIVAKEKTFTVEGDFSQNALLTAMNNAGFQGTIGR